MNTTVLERDVYTEAEAARLLGVPPSTLHYWLEGKQTRGKRYLPVIRQESRGEGLLTWGEFVEAGLLAQYRRHHDVRLPELRRFIEWLRSELGVPYPLATMRPWVGEGPRLLVAAQEQAKVPAEFTLAIDAGGQLLLTHPSESFLQRVEWDGDVAGRWHPHDDPGSPVVADPRMRFGRPHIGGISTEVIWEHLEGGEDADEVANAFGLTRDDVLWAQAFEHSRQSRPAA